MLLKAKDIKWRFPVQEKLGTEPTLQYMRCSMGIQCIKPGVTPRQRIWERGIQETPLHQKYPQPQGEPSVGR